MKQIANYISAAKVFDGYVSQITDEQWDSPTPDEGWSVRDLVNHVTSEDLWVKALLDGKTIAEVGTKFDGDVLGDDPKAARTNAGAIATDAFSAPGADDKTVQLSHGETASVDYAEQMFGDHLVHAWDLAKAIGKDAKLPEELVESAYAYFQKYAEDWRSGGAFKAAKTVSEDASVQDKLLALTGRNPNWSP